MIFLNYIWSLDDSRVEGILSDQLGPSRENTFFPEWAFEIVRQRLYDKLCIQSEPPKRTKTKPELSSNSTLCFPESTSKLSSATASLYILQNLFPHSCLNGSPELELKLSRFPSNVLTCTFTGEIQWKVLNSFRQHSQTGLAPCIITYCMLTQFILHISCTYQNCYMLHVICNLTYNNLVTLVTALIQAFYPNFLLSSVG